MSESTLQQTQLTDAEIALLKEMMEEVANKKELPKLSPEKLEHIEMIRKKLETQEETSEEIEKARRILRSISIIGQWAALGGGTGAVIGGIAGSVLFPGAGTVVGAAIGSFIAAYKKSKNSRKKIVDQESNTEKNEQ